MLQSNQWQSDYGLNFRSFAWALTEELMAHPNFPKYISVVFKEQAHLTVLYVFKVKNLNSVLKPV